MYGSRQCLLITVLITSVVAIVLLGTCLDCSLLLLVVWECPCKVNIWRCNVKGVFHCRGLCQCLVGVYTLESATEGEGLSNWCLDIICYRSSTLLWQMPSGCQLPLPYQPPSPSFTLLPSHFLLTVCLSCILHYPPVPLPFIFPPPSQSLFVPSPLPSICVSPLTPPFLPHPLSLSPSPVPRLRLALMFQMCTMPQVACRLQKTLPWHSIGRLSTIACWLCVFDMYQRTHKASSFWTTSFNVIHVTYL